MEIELGVMSAKKKIKKKKKNLNRSLTTLLNVAFGIPRLFIQLYHKKFPLIHGLACVDLKMQGIVVFPTTSWQVFNQKKKKNFLASLTNTI